MQTGIWRPGNGRDGVKEAMLAREAAGWFVYTRTLDGAFDCWFPPDADGRAEAEAYLAEVVEPRDVR